MIVHDYVQRRIIVEYGRAYVYLTLSDANGKILQEELFKQPFKLTAKEAAEEAEECWHDVYQFVSDTVVFPSASDDEDEGESE